MRGSKVEAKRTGNFRRTHPVVQPTFEPNEELYRAFSSCDCNKCNGTGKKKTLIFGTQRFFVPCKCVPMCLFGY